MSQQPLLTVKATILRAPGTDSRSWRIEIEGRGVWIFFPSPAPDNFMPPPGSAKEGDIGEIELWENAAPKAYMRRGGNTHWRWKTP